MRIIFLCGSLEPGLDGVGDYSRRLAGELIRQGHKAATVALNDRYVKVRIDDIQLSEENKVPVLRLPSKLPTNPRIKFAKEWIENFGPDWLSLQFVPYSYQAKGLPFGLSKQLSILGEGIKWHIMFHELWIGMGKGSSVKDIWIGSLQSKIISSLILKIKPQVIHTQCKLYQKQLSKLGFLSYYLPLFSNIPFVGKVILPEFQPKTNGDINIHLVSFGTIQPKTNIETFSKEIAEYAKLNKVKISLTLIGRCGKEQGAWIEHWEANGLKVNLLGELSPEEISEVLSNVSIGLSTTPILQIGKSGSFAAMREHALPVICVSKPWFPRGIHGLEIEGEAIEYIPGKIQECFEKIKHKAINNKLSDISKILTESLFRNNTVS